MIKLLSWYVGVKNNWQVNPGLYGKWFKRYLSPELWILFERTYAGADYEEMWTALFDAGKLVRKLGVEIADDLGYVYPLEDDERVTNYLKRVRFLPKNAETFI